MAAWSSSAAGRVQALGTGVVGAVILSLAPAPAFADRYAILMCGFDERGYESRCDDTEGLQLDIMDPDRFSPTQVPVEAGAQIWFDAIGDGFSYPAARVPG